MEKERGSITLYVLITCLFFVFILSITYIGTINKLQVQEQEVKQIQKNYERDAEQVYNEMIENTETRKKILIATTKTEYVSIVSQQANELGNYFKNAEIECKVENAQQYLENITASEYDLIIVNNGIGRIQSTLMNNLAKQTNIITISDDATSNLDIINKSKIVVPLSGGLAYEYNPITIESIMTDIGRQKLGIELKEKNDTGMRAIEFNEGVEVLYRANYSNPYNNELYVSEKDFNDALTDDVSLATIYAGDKVETDAIGYYKNSKTNKVWIHSQISLETETEDIKLIELLVKYALGSL